MILGIIYTTVGTGEAEASLVEHLLRPGLQFAPENNERAAYMLYMLLVVPVSALFALLSVYITRKESAERILTGTEKVLSAVTWGLLLLVIFIFMISAEYRIYDTALFRWRNLAITVTAFAIALIGYMSKSVKPFILGLTAVMCAVATALACFAMYMDVGSIYEQEHHYSAYASSVLAVLHGRTLLVDHMSQYGLYAYFLAPIFRVVDFNIHNFSIIMIFLLAIALLCNWLTIRLLIKKTWLRLLIYFNLVCFTTHYYGLVHLGIDVGSYYQYGPHRVIFPSIIILLFVKFAQTVYQKPNGGDVKGGNTKGRVYFALLIFITALSIVWNLDTGVVAYGASLVGLGFYALCRSFGGDNKLSVSDKKHSWYRLALYFLSVPVLAILFIITVTSIRTGTLFLDFTGLFLFQSLFYRHGFGAVPMTLFHPWVLFALIYTAGISLSVTYAVRVMRKRKTPDYNYACLLFLCIMAVGLFSYFQGSSHNANLLSVSASGFIVIALLIENMQKYFPRFGVSFVERCLQIAKLDRGRPVSNPFLKYLQSFDRLGIIGISGMIIVFMLFLQPFGSLLNYNRVADAVENKITRLGRLQDDSWADSVLPLIGNNEEIIIIAEDSEAYISARLGKINAILDISYIELLAMEQYEHLLYELRGNTEKKVFIDMQSLYLFVEPLAMEILESGKYEVLWTDDRFILLDPI